MPSLGSDARGPVLSGTPLQRPLRTAPVDAYALEQRAARLTARSIKRESKDAGLELAALGDAPIKVASAAGAFPSGQIPLAERLVEIRRAVEGGADEIDIVLNRGALLAGRIDVVHDEVAASKEACGHAHLKTILETAELGSYEMVRPASVVAMAADLESRAAENLKRTTRTGGREDLRTAMAYCEIRTVWHPARI